MIDRDAMRELHIYLQNEGKLYPKKKQIIENLKKKIASGKYEHKLGAVLWEYWVEDGARAYAKEYATPGEWAKIFTKRTRDALAVEIEREEFGRITRGEYGPLK